ncbi:LUD domain-containing protein [Halopenitus sp. POP-27]|uniref:LUD domain-containing protein n=1 Tax=Halopenitus sp. POP-27 TaxID=2994425 RepID=UPI00246936DD|nr:LUD domain-containing protein [Halopenitus sp. POP-27]
MSGRVTRFEQSATQGPTTVDRIHTDEFDDALADVLEGPAVGAPLPFEGVSLPQDVTRNPTPRELRDARIGVTPVGPAVADLGSVVVRSGAEGAEQISLYPDTHVAVLAASDIQPTIADAITEIDARVASGLTSAVLATGPSGTGDMGSVVYGAHGPSSVHVIVLEDR